MKGKIRVEWGAKRHDGYHEYNVGLYFILNRV